MHQLPICMYVCMYLIHALDLRLVSIIFPIEKSGKQTRLESGRVNRFSYSFYIEQYLEICVNCVAPVRSLFFFGCETPFLSSE